MSWSIRQRTIPLLLLLGAALGAGSCSSPTKPTQPVDQFPEGPHVTCPAAPGTLTSLSGQSMPVSYGTATATGGAPPLATVCAPPSGSNFPVGSTTVSCTVTDARQRTDACSFSIVVQQPPKLGATAFVAFGDSITAGEDGASVLAPAEMNSPVRPHFLLPGPQRYPSVLQQLLQGRYQTQTIRVDNAGLPGEKAGAADTFTRFSNALALSSYGAVLIMEGTNDIYERDAGEIPAAVNGLRRMIQTARGRSIRPYLATIPPMVAGRPRGLAWSLVPAMNSAIRSLAVSENVTLVDVEGAFGTAFEQYIGFDGEHPNAAGYAKIADTFFGVLKSTLEAPLTTTLGALRYP